MQRVGVCWTMKPKHPSPGSKTWDKCRCLGAREGADTQSVLSWLLSTLAQLLQQAALKPLGGFRARNTHLALLNAYWVISLFASSLRSASWRLFSGLFCFLVALFGLWNKIHQQLIKTDLKYSCMVKHKFQSIDLKPKRVNGTIWRWHLVTSRGRDIPGPELGCAWCKLC